MCDGSGLKWLLFSVCVAWFCVVGGGIVEWLCVGVCGCGVVCGLTPVFLRVCESALRRARPVHYMMQIQPTNQNDGCGKVIAEPTQVIRLVLARAS